MNRRHWLRLVTAKPIVNVGTKGHCDWGKPMTKSRQELIGDAEFRIGKWLSAALDDPEVCAEMKLDIVNWFTAIETVEPAIEEKYVGALKEIAKGQQPMDYGKPIVTMERLREIAAEALKKLE